MLFVWITSKTLFPSSTFTPPPPYFSGAVASLGMSSAARTHGDEGKHYPAPLAPHEDVVNDSTLFWDTLRRFHFVMGTKFMYASISCFILLYLFFYSYCFFMNEKKNVVLIIPGWAFILFCVFVILSKCWTVLPSSTCEGFLWLEGRS